MEQFKTQLQTGMQSAMKQLRPELLPELLTDRIRKSGEPNSSASIDLFLLLESRELDRTQLSSVFGKLVTEMATNSHLVGTDSLRSRRDCEAAPVGNFRKDP